MAALVKASLYAVVYCIKAGKDASKRTYQAFKQLLKSDEQALYNSDREALAATERHIDEKTFNAIANAQQAGDIAVADVYAALLSKLGKPDIIEKILLRLPKEQLSDLIKDLDNADFARLLTQKPERADDWLLLLGKPQLRKDPTALEAVSRLRKNPDAAGLGIDDQLIKQIDGWAWGDGLSNTARAGFSEVIDQINSFASYLVKKKVSCNNCNRLWEIFKTNAKTDKQAAFWTMEDMVSDAGTFGNRSITLEYQVGKASGAGGRIDVKVDIPGDAPLLIEYKWYGGSDNIKQELFVDEFINRDLFTINKLSDLQWRIKGNKLTKAKVLDHLKSTEGREALNNLPLAKKQQFFKDYDKISGVTDSNIEQFVVDSFDLIFK